MLLHDHPGSQGVGVVVRQHGYGGLRHDRPGIEFRHDVVHGAAVQAHAGFKCPLVGVGALEQRQQGGVDVDHPACPGLDEGVGEDAHEAGQHDQLDARPLQFRLKRGVEARPVGKRLVVDGAGRDAGLPRAVEAGGVGAVREHEHDLGRIVGGARCLDQRDHVRAAARDQDRDAFFSGRSAHSANCPVNVTGSAPRSVI